MKRCILFAAVVVMAVAGCGGARTITRTVQAQPCATAAGFSDCLDAIETTYVTASEGVEADVHAYCQRRTTSRFTCLLLVHSGYSGTDSCWWTTVVRTSFGSPVVIASTPQDQAPTACDTRWKS